ncbi:MAG TPA: hypothetical protein VOA78_08325 [Candidatus Dormibacteraeota bacterium]|nr:hypothetical protein [Candidatus Dormibacteraeota bacterium]
MPDHLTFFAAARRAASRFGQASLGAFFLGCCLCLAACDSAPTKPAAAAAEPAKPAMPEDMQAVATTILGREAQVLAYGDLAKTGKQQVLAANVVPKTPQNTIPGTVVTRAVIAENDDGKWTEILRADEHLKNTQGFLALSPIDPISGWRLQWEQNTETGLQLYFTPVKGNSDPHVLPVGVRWNPKTKRYQSLDRSYEHFLLESPSLGEARSTLR